MPGNLGGDGLLDRPAYGLKVFRVLGWFDGPLEGQDGFSLTHLQ